MGRIRAPLAALALVLGLAPTGSARAAITNGSFESGLTGWTVLGDVSLQGAGIGTPPADGASQVLLSTNAGFIFEPDPYSGNSAISDSDLESAAGLPAGTFDALSPSGQNAVHGSAIQQSFTAEAGSTLRLCWNFLTDEVDPFLLQGDDFAALSVEETTTSTQVSLSSLVNVAAATYQPSTGTPFEAETGYQLTEVTLPVTGTYVLSVAALDARHWWGSSALLVDDVRIFAPAPEPGTVLLVGVGLLGLVWLSRPRRAPPPSRRPRPPAAS